MTRTEMVERLKHILKRADEALAWYAAGFPVNDPHDTYPDDLYDAAVSASQMKPLLEALLVEIETLATVEAEVKDDLKANKCGIPVLCRWNKCKRVWETVVKEG